MTEMEQFTDAVKRLNGLLQEPELGLFSWVMGVKEVWTQTQKAAKLLGLSKPPGTVNIEAGGGRITIDQETLVHDFMRGAPSWERSGKLVAQFLEALYREGVDISAPEFARALNNALEPGWWVDDYISEREAADAT